MSSYDPDPEDIYVRGKHNDRMQIGWPHALVVIFFLLCTTACCLGGMYFTIGQR